MHVKTIIDKLVEKHGSLRKVGKASGVSHQKLSNWRSKDKEYKKFLDFLSWARKELKMSKSRFLEELEK